MSIPTASANGAPTRCFPNMRRALLRLPHVSRPPCVMPQTYSLHLLHFSPIVDKQKPLPIFSLQPNYSLFDGCLGSTLNIWHPHLPNLHPLLPHFLNHFNDDVHTASKLSPPIPPVTFEHFLQCQPVIIVESCSFEPRGSATKGH